jgi:hypothetical protein
VLIESPPGQLQIADAPPAVSAALRPVARNTRTGTAVPDQQPNCGTALQFQGGRCGTLCCSSTRIVAPCVSLHVPRHRAHRTVAEILAWAAAPPSEQAEIRPMEHRLLGPWSSFFCKCIAYISHCILPQSKCGNICLVTNRVGPFDPDCGLTLADPTHRRSKRTHTSGSAWCTSLSFIVCLLNGRRLQVKRRYATRGSLLQMTLPSLGQPDR